MVGVAAAQDGRVGHRRMGVASSASSVHADDPANLGSPLSYAVEVLADDDPEDLGPAAAALSKSRRWVLAALRAGGDMQTVKQLGTAWPRPATR